VQVIWGPVKYEDVWIPFCASGRGIFHSRILAVALRDKNSNFPIHHDVDYHVDGVRLCL
jgi:hypothetical protein